MNGGRARSLPIAPRAQSALRHLPLAGEERDVDRVWRPTYAVWELTLKCDLACGHCARWPRSVDTLALQDFSLRRFDIEEARFIAGFGDIRWLPGSAFSG